MGPDLSSPPSVPPIRRRTISHRGISRTISHRGISRTISHPGISRTISHRGISRPYLFHVITRRRRSHDVEHHNHFRWIIRSSTTTSGTGILPWQTKLKQNASTGGRSWHVSHNGGPGLSQNRYHSSLSTTRRRASLRGRPRSIFLRYGELRSVSFEINAVSFEPGLILVHALRAMKPVPSGTRIRTRVHTHLAHKIKPHSTRHNPVFVVAQYIYCYSSLTDIVNTTSYIAIPYDYFSS